MHKKWKRGLGLLDGAALPLPWMNLVCFNDKGEGGDPGGGGGDPAGGGAADPGGGGDPAGGEGGARRGRASAADIAKAAGGDAGGDPPAAFNGSFDLALVPDNLRGASAEETLHKLFPSWKGLRDAQASAGAVPEKPDAYAVPELSDEAKKYFPDLEKDEVFQIVRRVSHKHGITDKRFGPLWGELLEDLGKSGLIQPVVDPAEEAKKLGGGQEAARQSQLANSFVERQKSMLAQNSPGALDKELIDELDMIAGTANGIRLINWFQSKMGEKGVTIDDPADTGAAWTPEKVKAAMRDERYFTDSPKYDPAYRKRVDDANRALSGRA